MEEITELLPEREKLVELTMTYGGKLLLAIITLIVGLWLIGKLNKGLRKAFEMRSFDQTLQSFLANLVGMVLKILLLVSVVSMLGVQMTSFIALLGAAGLAIGMALSGTMQNFAGGVMLLIFKPFKVGDFIEAQGHMGTVKEVQIFHTVLNTPDKKTVIIPNGGLSTGSMTNFSTEPIRRLDWTFGISYTDNIDKAREIIIGVVSADERVHKDPAPFVGLINLGDSSVDLVTRVWVFAADYWDLFFEINEKVKKEFDKQGISIPFPQRDVHLIQAKE
ncbi:MAG: mechanosensitive ion channel [Bacteroidales bacterium]|nr:mechanosensitive ion channel [Bacteroidales bacterium]